MPRKNTSAIGSRFKRREDTQRRSKNSGKAKPLCRPKSSSSRPITVEGKSSTRPKPKAKATLTATPQAEPKISRPRGFSTAEYRESKAAAENSTPLSEETLTPPPEPSDSSQSSEEDLDKEFEAIIATWQDALEEQSVLDEYYSDAKDRIQEFFTKIIEIKREIDAAFADPDQEKLTLQALSQNHTLEPDYVAYIHDLGTLDSPDIQELWLQVKPLYNEIKGAQALFIKESTPYNYFTHAPDNSLSTENTHTAPSTQ